MHYRTRLDSITESTDGSTWRRMLSAFSSSFNRSLDNLDSRDSCYLTSRDSCLTSRDSCHVTSTEKLATGKRAFSLSVGTSLAHSSKHPSGLVTSKSLDKGERRGLRKRLFSWNRRPLGTFLVLRGTTIAQFNINIVNEFQKFNIQHKLDDTGYKCKHNSSKRSFLGQGVKFSLQRRSDQLGTLNPVIVQYFHPAFTPLPHISKNILLPICYFRVVTLAPRAGVACFLNTGSRNRTTPHIVSTPLPSLSNIYQPGALIFPILPK
eukprot:sb/3468366/